MAHGQRVTRKLRGGPVSAAYSPATCLPPESESSGAHRDAVTQALDPAVTASTGDTWSAFNELSSAFAPVYLNPGQCATITVTITPTASAGSNASGTLYVSDLTLGQFIGAANSNGDEITNRAAMRSITWRTYRPALSYSLASGSHGGHSSRGTRPAWSEPRTWPALASPWSSGPARRSPGMRASAS